MLARMELMPSKGPRHRLQITSALDYRQEPTKRKRESETKRKRERERKREKERERKREREKKR